MITAHGIAHGNLIQLSDDLGLEDGQEVEVVVRKIKGKQNWGEGIQRSAGGMAPYWTTEDDQILEEIRLDRGRASGREIPR